MSSEAPSVHAPDEDERTLHKLGYAQVLYREMGGFSNFAISFSIISILTGAVLAQAGLVSAHPAAPRNRLHCAEALFSL